MENTGAPNLPLPQQPDVESGTNQSPSPENSREPEASFSSSQPETHEPENIQPSYGGANEMTQTPSPQESLTEPGPVINNADVGSAGLNDRPSFETSDTNRISSSSEPQNSNTEPAEDIPLNEGSDVNSMNFRPRIDPGSELSDSKANPSYAGYSRIDTNPRPEIQAGMTAKEASSYERQEEKDATLETFAKLAMNDELPTKSNEPPTKSNESPTKSNEPPTKSNEPPTKSTKPPTKSKAAPIKSKEPPSLTYIAPVNAKVPIKDPAPTLIKLPPAIALLTPKRGINVFFLSSF